MVWARVAFAWCILPFDVAQASVASESVEVQMEGQNKTQAWGTSVWQARSESSCCLGQTPWERNAVPTPGWCFAARRLSDCDAMGREAGSGKDAGKGKKEIKKETALRPRVFHQGCGQRLIMNQARRKQAIKQCLQPASASTVVPSPMRWSRQPETGCKPAKQPKLQLQLRCFILQPSPRG